MNNISKLRMKILESGGPQYMIGGRAGISPTRISEYCLMQKPIPFHHVLSLCEVLECQPEDIVGEWDNPDGVRLQDFKYNPRRKIRD